MPDQLPVAASSRPPGVRTMLIRWGFDEPDRALRRLTDPAILRLADVPKGDDVEATARAVLVSGRLDALRRAADPDLALTSLTRLLDERTPMAEIKPLVPWRDPRAEQALVKVLGASAGLADHLVRHPADTNVVAAIGTSMQPPGVGWPAAASVVDVRAALLVAVGADPWSPIPTATLPGAESITAMRRAYRRRLLEIATADICSERPEAILPDVAAALADLASAALEAALATARRIHLDAGDVCVADLEGTQLAIIGMGKCGGRELNYVSDVDVVYVVEQTGNISVDRAIDVGAKLATTLAHVCAGSAAEPALWPVDAALRPEGKNGPLVRSMASFESYYESWAKTWEFQALLKARPVAGDPDLGARWYAMTRPLVWQAIEREHFVEDAQAMRRRVESNVSPAEVDRQLKLGPGGLRDVEFSVQLLQMVHGRSDPSLHSGTTLTALQALIDGGYVGRADGRRLGECYRFLRVLEHRLQLFRLRRTHLMPTAARDLRRLARTVPTLEVPSASSSSTLALSRAPGAAARSGEDSPEVRALMDRWRRTKRDVRHLHEAMFYRPLLPATARLSTDEASLSPDAAMARLAALGYRDPAGAMRHITALTGGTTRRFAIQRQLLPVMLGWFADGSDPDGGLLAFRRLADDLGDTHWFLSMLRDSGVAAHRLAATIASSRFIADSLDRMPESVTWFGAERDLTPRSIEQLQAETAAVIARREETDAGVRRLRQIRHRELLRTAIADVLGLIDVPMVASTLTAVTDAVLARTVETVERGWQRSHGDLPTRLVVIAMGRLGGKEIGYSSDADVMFAHEPVAGADSEAADRAAGAMVATMRSLLSATADTAPVEIDADLRPEGRNGPMVRTLESFAEYYRRWARPWEWQALLRARPVGGDLEAGRRFVELIAPYRYPQGGLADAQLREIRRIKARVESERLPRGADPARHIKLGRGGLADIEWTAQLLQLQYAAAVPSLRVESTVPALQAAAEARLIAQDDAELLIEAWQFATRVRSGVVLATGAIRPGSSDQLPHDRRTLSAVATVLGYPSGRGDRLAEDYLRSARRARAVVERVFFG